MEAVVAGITFVDSDNGRTYTVRHVKEDALTDDSSGRYIVGPVGWRTEPLPFAFSDVEGDPHSEARYVASAFNFRREQIDGATWVVSDLDWDSDDLALEAKRLVDEGRITGVSISPAEAEGFLICGIPPVQASKDELAALAANFDPESCDRSDWVEAWVDVVIGSSTLLMNPAFEDAQVVVAGGQGEASDGSEWDAGEAMRKAGAADDPAAAFRAIALETTIGEPSERQHWALPHHKTPGSPANAAAVRNARARFDQTENLKDREAARRHLFGVHRLPSEVEAAVQAGVDLALPPVEWFTHPEPDEPTPGTVTEEGQFYGHLTGQDCHRGFFDRCVLPPQDAANFEEFHNNGSVTFAGGETLRVGNVTVDLNHADIRTSTDKAKAHYDHSGAVVAQVRATQGKHGIWLAGAITPWATAEQVEKLRRLRLSGDWRPTRDGRHYLIAAQAVAVPGFPIRARVAAGAMQEYTTLGPEPHVQLEDVSDLALVASALGRLAVKVDELVADKRFREFRETVALFDSI